MTLEIRETSDTSELKHGHKAVGTSAVQLTPDKHKFLRGTIIKADAGNTGIVFVGSNANVTADNDAGSGGFPLAAGDAFEIPISDPSGIFIIASAVSQDVAWMGV